VPKKWGRDPIAIDSSFGDSAEVISSTTMRAKEIEMEETLITREGLERLNAELENLKSERRLEIAERLNRAAATEANRAENADYLGVREDQAFLERRIALLEERLRSAQVVEPQLGNGRIDVGEHVRLRDLDSGERIEVELVGPLESDPNGGRISTASPLGQAIIGLRRGQIANVNAPRGTIRFKILAVEARAA
jgi:transcription elongation factor GreA